MLHTIKDTNTKNLPQFCPYKIVDKEIIEMDLDRWEYVYSFILDIGICSFRQNRKVKLIVEENSLPLELEEQEAPFGKSKSNVAVQKLSTAEYLIQQLRIASLWSFNFEEWYPGVASVSSVTNITLREYNIIPDVCFIPLNAEKITFIRRCLKKKLWYVSPFSSEEKERIEELERYITERMTRFSNGKFDEFFFRMSGHSPKDVPLSLKVKDGKDVMNLMLRSGRILIDLDMLRKFLIRAKYQNIILLPWNSNMNSEMEFRCFVYEGVLTAISQYEYAQVYESLQNHEFLKTISESITFFHKKISSSIKFNSYVFDVFLSPVIKESKKEYFVYLIELNPFSGDLSSGSCLFDWEDDKNIILNSKTKNPIVRIRVDEKTALNFQ